jgi:hypothetical protein
MQLRAPAIAALSLLANVVSAQPPATGGERDFVFTDDDGHLVLRFVGAGPGAPDRHQRDEILNQEFSVMIHDDLRADLQFESERVDAEWAALTEPRIEARADQVRSAFSAIEIECRSTTCRLMLEHADRRSVREHQQLIAFVQDALAPLVGSESSGFERSYLIAAYEQRAEAPLIKVYLRRTTDAGQAL